MTTIITDGQAMASDGLLTGNGFIHSTTHQKVFKLSDGRIAGVAGSAFEVTAFTEWLEAGGGDIELDEDFEALVLHPDGTVRCYDSKGHWFSQSVPAVIGSGGAYAAVAMDAGLSLTEAVRAAIKRDCYSGGRVKVIKL